MWEFPVFYSSTKLTVIGPSSPSVKVSAPLQCNAGQGASGFIYAEGAAFGRYRVGHRLGSQEDVDYQPFG